MDDNLFVVDQVNVKYKRRLKLSYYISAALAVLMKDISCEMRSKHSITALLLFAVTSTVAVSFTLANYGSSSAVSSALLWVVIYFSAMSGLSRSFVAEEETYTANSLKLAAPPNSVYIGKLAFNFLIMVAVEIIAVPLFVLLMSCPVDRWGLFIAVLALGSLGLSAGATTAAAMVSKASTKGALFAAISFPLLVPVLAVAIHGTGLAMDAHAIRSAGSDIRLLISYCGMVLTASIMLFKYIWEN